MSYLETFATLPNITSHLSATTYGDLLIRRSNDGKPEYLVQHNHAQYVQEPGLVPFVAGFPTPFLNLSLYGEFKKKKYRFEDENKQTRRNLLTSELLETGKGVRIFSVPNSSKRNILIVSEVEYNTKEDSDIDYGMISLNRLPSHVENKQLEKRAVELKVFEGIDESSKRLFIRNINGLDFYNVEDDQIHNLFNDDIVKFFQIPGLEDEIAILDEKKRVWYGTMGRNIIRKKTIFEPNDIAPTTCPRILLLGNYSEVRLLDLRDNRPDATLHFELPDLKNNYLYDSIMRNLIEATEASHRERIINTTAVKGREYTTIITTNHYHYLIDQRVPNKFILAMPHSILQDNSYCLTTPEIKHPKTNNFFHTFLSLNQSENNVSYWPLQIDMSNNIWSSVSSLKVMPTTVDIKQFCKTTSNLRRRNIYKLPTKITSICHQLLPQTSSYFSNSLLLHQTEDNSLWYSNFVTHFMDSDVFDLGSLRSDSVKSMKKYYKNLIEDGTDAGDILKKPKDNDTIPMKKWNFLNLPELNALDESQNDNDDENNYGLYDVNISTEAGINTDEYLPKMDVNEDSDLIGYYTMKSWKDSSNALRKYLMKDNILPELEEGISRIFSEDKSRSDINTDTVINQNILEDMNDNSNLIVDDEDDFDYGELPC